MIDVLTSPLGIRRNGDSQFVCLSPINQMSPCGPPPLVSNRILAGLSSTALPGEALTLIPRYGPCEAESLKARMVKAVASLGEAEVSNGLGL